ncbi:type III-A CRISPR-associated protein Cas10/Csm1 [Thermoflexus sp.]|uniref:type III-A CRISPR-associated protein Cas10/Csm1 n=1 Tax=Thermoflexus sp. TaxID=1969742 RepID=UPI00260F28C8|nr:type III-A CRISPR-associated protein Cas10/Csm1 [Thermoflexus sp.]MCX7691664.1 type III-A CRISPR-associated protein Cas10/Csm1 [Thermoflexus sp.]
MSANPSADRAFQALIGLLHDIGKFRQRALWGLERRPHEEHGAEWTAERLAPRLAFLSPADRRRLVEAIRDHHGAPYDRDARALIVADRLASGERAAREDEEVGDPAREPLRALPAALRLPGRSPLPDASSWGYRTTPLPGGPGGFAPEAWEAIFPQPVGSLSLGYPGLWKGFEDALEGLHPEVWQGPASALTALLAMLRRFAWCIPAAAYRDEPDVSLYDHLRAVAALTVCIGEFPEETLRRFEEATRGGRFPDEPVALLVGGDLSGIQRFLYAISSEGAAKSLRGRSAYLSLLADATVEFILRELDLPPTQLVYSSGGHFFLIAPLSARDRLSGLAERIDEVLVEAHGGDLAIALEAVTLHGKDFHLGEGRLPERWAELSARLGERKARRFDRVLERHYARLVGPFGGGGLQDRCDVCHAEAEKIGAIERPVERRPDEDVQKCSLCRSFEELGSDLARRNAYMVLRPVRPAMRGRFTWRTVLNGMGLDVRFCDERELPRSFQPGDRVIRVHHADLTPFGDVPVHDFRYLPVFTPIERDGSIVELNRMAETSRGNPAWACLRMDVDHLGRLFRFGLGDRYSLSRVATLSHMLSLFFEGYLPVLCGEVDPERQHLYLIYSGGDDLLLVGSWDRALEAAFRIRERFRAFAAGNPSVTLSGGISMHREKFPLYQAAAEAGDHLEAAKGLRHPDGRDKDAFGFFGVVLAWEEAEWIRGWAMELERLIRPEDPEASRLARGFLHRLMSIAVLIEAEAQLGRAARLRPQDLARMVGFHRARWRLVYAIARQPNSVRPVLQRFQQELLDRGGERLRLLHPLARWVEWMTRR